jgi:hypothetical protein
MRFITASSHIVEPSPLDGLVTFNNKAMAPARTVEQSDEVDAESSTGPHRMRITSGGSVAGYVKFALDFLQVCLANS